MSETKIPKVMTNGNGGVDWKKVAVIVTIAIFTVSIIGGLVGQIYSKDSRDLDTLKGEVKQLQSDSADVKTKIAVIETKITQIEQSQKRMEDNQEKVNDKLDRLLDAVQSRPDSGRRNP